MAISSGATGLEAAVVLTEGDDVDVRAASELAGPGVPVLVGDARGTIRTRTTTHGPDGPT